MSSVASHSNLLLVIASALNSNYNAAFVLINFLLLLLLLFFSVICFIIIFIFEPS